MLGFKGPRKMTILLPKAESSNYYKQIGLNSDISLTDLNKTDPKSVIKLKNKTPVSASPAFLISSLSILCSLCRFGTRRPSHTC